MLFYTKSRNQLRLYFKISDSEYSSVSSIGFYMIVWGSVLGRRALGEISAGCENPFNPIEQK